MLRVSNQIVLDFVKVLDQRQLREDDTGEVGGAAYLVRVPWLKTVPLERSIH
jgi:hypothetical protein